MSAHVFLKNLRLRNFRSVRSADIAFDNPLFLVGRNGSGKSSVIDAIAFLADCVNLSLKGAMERRDFLSRAVYTRIDKDWPFIELKADVVFGSANNDGHNGIGHYLLRLKIIRLKIENDGYTAEYNGDFEVDTEECFVKSQSGTTHFFNRSGDHFESSVTGLKPRLGSQNLALPLVGGIEEFALLADGFAGMRVYHIDHRKIRAGEGSEASTVLSATGENIAGVLFPLTNQWETDSIHSALHSVTPSATRFFSVPMRDGTFSLHGIQQRQADSGVMGYDRQAFSDGTLHALGLAVALLQHPSPSVLVIEEPENNLHPGALTAISDLIEEASRKTQVIITTHSPDLLDAKWIAPENLRVVTWENDASRVSQLAERPQKALREHLMYAGQLMRANAREAVPAEAADEAATDYSVTVMP